MDMLLPESERTGENLRRITDYLERRAGADSCLDEVSDTCYGRVLWDVRSRTDRPEYFRGLELL